MKKVILAALAACAMFASCNKDDSNKAGQTEKGAAVNINIEVPETNESRASGTAAPADVVNNFSVFITDASDDIRWKAYSATGADLTGASAIAVNTSAKNVYVVANAGNLTGTISTMVQLNAFLADLDGTPNQTIGRWATGNTTTALDFRQVGNNFEATASVALTFIAARITVTVDNQLSNYGSAGSLTLDDITVLNARGESKLFGVTLIPESYSAGKKFYTGIPFAPNFTYFPATEDYTYNAATAILLGDALNLSVPSTIYYYYVFENDAITAATFPTIVTLTGTDYNGDDLYWPVHLAPYEQWAAGSSVITGGIQRGRSYNINIKLTGNATNGGGSTDDPTKPVRNATVEVLVTLRPWIPVLLNKEF